MRIALIHATTSAIQPIDQALRMRCPNIKIFHFMDTGLLEMIQQDGELSSRIKERFNRLIQQAIDTQVDCIQLTCSAFNNIVEEYQPHYSIKLFRSDEAMLDQALQYDRIGLISTVRETPIALSHYIRSKNPNTTIRSIIRPDAIELLFKGKQEEHDRIVQEMIYELAPEVDILVLSQYSMEQVRNQVEVDIPILTGSELAAERCLQYLISSRKI